MLYNRQHPHLYIYESNIPVAYHSRPLDMVWYYRNLNYRVEFPYKASTCAVMYNRQHPRLYIDESNIPVAYHSRPPEYGLVPVLQKSHL
jgi:hypothetical protein